MALTPSDLRRRKMNLLMAMSYAAFASSKASAWSPTLLFAAGEQGAWYDPSDFSTMYQDAAGTTPVTAVEQPVGLLLDKSKGLALGAELVPDSDFNASASWTPETADWVVSGGKATYTKPVSGIQYLQSNDNISIVSGTWYRLTFTVSGIASGSAIFGLFNKAAAVNYLGSYQTITANGTYSVYFLATSSTTGLRIYGNASGTATSWSFESFSIKAIAGNHASQSTAASRPVLSARVNLLTQTDDLNDSGYAAFQVTKTVGGVVGPLGRNGTTLREVAVTNIHIIDGTPTFSVTSGTTYTASIYVKPAGRTRVKLNASSTWNSGVPDAYYDLVGAGSYDNVGSGVTPTITAITGGWYLLTYSVAANTTSALAKVYLSLVSTGTTTNYAGDITKGVDVFGYDIRVTNDGVGLPAYQRIAAATDYDTSGFPLYLKFDGVDDSLATGTIDFTATDKMSVFAGVQKLTDTAYQVISELSANVSTNNGAFSLLSTSGAGTSVANALSFGLRGTAISGYDATTFSAPSTNVVAANYDISGAAIGSEIFPRVNGSIPTLTSTSGANAGTGNFGSYPFYIGRRNNASLPYNGNLYSLIVRGALSTDAQIASTETYVNSKTGAY